MVGCSLRHAGAEILETGGGLARYARERGTMGIPLLHPWANRLDGLRFRAGRREVDLDLASPLLALDPNGLPIHGLLAAHAGWEVTRVAAEEGSSELSAHVDFAADPELLRLFPFPHRLEMEVRLANETLTVATTLRATGEDPVPVSFGYHPYFRLPGAPASGWELSMPVRAHVEVDERLIPTGESVPVRIEPAPLGGRTFDDGYDRLDEPARFVVVGGRRRLTVEFIEGYPVAVIWRPAGGEFLCIEPMTARTNALASGDPDLRLVEPGGAFTASFTISVEHA
jgi:aldose 1-epimerase